MTGNSTTHHVDDGIGKNTCLATQGRILCECQRSILACYSERPRSDSPVQGSATRCRCHDCDGVSVNAREVLLVKPHDTLTLLDREVMQLVITDMLNRQVAAEPGSSRDHDEDSAQRVMRNMQAEILSQGNQGGKNDLISHGDGTPSPKPRSYRG